MRHTLITWVAASLLLSLQVETASAHLGSTKYIRIDMTSREVALTVDIDTVDLAYELGVPDAERVSSDALVRDPESIHEWMKRRLLILSGGRVLEPRSQSLPESIFLEGTSRMAIRIEAHYTTSGAGSVMLRDDSVFDSNPRHESIVRVGDSLKILRDPNREVALELPPSPAAMFVDFVEEGARHLIGGYDHVLFLLALLLTAGERARRNGLALTLREVGKIITGFTVGHSLTLIAASLEWITVAGYYVEIAIAASIVWVAIANLVRTDSRADLPSVAFALGLIHGLGFSSVLAELAVPTSERVITLVGFNLGIELAQLAIVLVMLPVLAYLARYDFYRNVVVRGGSVAIALVAGGWVIARLG